MHPNFPTLKTQRMMRATPSGALMPAGGGGLGAAGSSGQSGVGGGSQSDVDAVAADKDVCWDYIYSFGALKRLCAKHMKKLEQEERHLHVSPPLPACLSVVFLLVVSFCSFLLPRLAGHRE